MRVYDVRLFGESREAVSAYYASHGVSGTAAGVVEPIQVGKFSASSGPLFQVAFHPTIHGILGATADSGEVKVYRFDYSGAQFRIQCVAVLRGHSGPARPLLFNSEVPWLLFSGGWDGTVIAWNWVTQESLWRF